MSRTILDMSISLDGFIAGPNETVDNGLGDGGQRLHDWGMPRDANGNYLEGELSDVDAEGEWVPVPFVGTGEAERLFRHRVMKAAFLPGAASTRGLETR